MGGQDAIILGGARLKDGLSMTFGLTWRFVHGRHRVETK